MATHLPWVEKYRPIDLNHVASHDGTIHAFGTFVRTNHVPNMLLYGVSGTGKTSIVQAFARAYHGDLVDSMTLELNGSDERGVTVVRDLVHNFAKSRCALLDMLGNNRQLFKLVILDEVDAMTNEAQFALRSIMEQFAKTTRFVLICNALTRVLPCLQSRCSAVIKMAPIPDPDHLQRLTEIVAKENVDIEAEALRHVVTVCEGDMRRSINLLQTMHMSQKPGTPLTLHDVCASVGVMPPQEAQRLMTFLFGRATLEDKLNLVDDLAARNALSVQELMRTVVDAVTYDQDHMQEPDHVAQLICELANIEVALGLNCNVGLQLHAVVAIVHLLGTKNLRS